MQVYATFDPNGNPFGFYFEEVHGDKMPDDVIAISDEDYQVYVQEQGKWIYKEGQRIAAPPPPPPTSEQLLSGIRAERNRLLAECDWTQLSDTVSDKAGWAEYRQTLRDFPGNCNPADPVWPQAPSINKQSAE